MANGRLSVDDVNRLSSDPSGETRALTAGKLAEVYGPGKLSSTELHMAEEIFRLMVRDAEVRVREALSANLKSNPLVPRDIAVSLAKDVESVAIPMLEFSEVLTTEDLVEIVRSQGPAKQGAVAKRRTIHADVADALVENGTEEVVASLMSNPGAHLTEPCMHKAVDRFGDSETVQEPMVNRPVLPVTVAERLVTKVADHLRQQLIVRHPISPEMAADLVLHSRERATVNLAMSASDDEVAALVGQLSNNRRLTPSLVLRAVCMGNLKFFEHAIARLAGVPLQNTRLLIHDPGGKGLDTLCRRAELPDIHVPAIKAAVSVVGETEFDGFDDDQDRYSRRIIERVLTQYESFGVDFEGDDLEYLLSRMNQLPAAFHTVH